MNLFTGQQWICRHKEETYGHRMEEEGGTNGESSKETYILPYVKQIVNGNLLQVTIWSREGNGTPLQYSCLENLMDGGAWWAAVHGVTRSRTRLSNFTLFFHSPALEKEMATRSSVLAWRIPGRGSLMGCRLRGRTESNMTEATQQQQLFAVIQIGIKPPNIQTVGNKNVSHP